MKFHHTAYKIVNKSRKIISKIYMKPQQIKIIKIILFKNNNNVEITIF